MPSAIKVFNWLGTHAQGLHPLRRADALRAGLHRPVHHGRADRAVRRLAGGRRAPDPDLLRRRAFPLHHGGRHGVGVLRRAALLVAEDHRAAVSARSGRASRPAIIFFGFNLTFFPQFILGYLRDAAALCDLRAGVPGPERAQLRRRRDPGRRVPAAAGLPAVVAVARRARAGQPVGQPGLEWKTRSPPPVENFEQTPVVTGDPYDFPPPEHQGAFAGSRGDR